MKRNRRFRADAYTRPCGELTLEGKPCLSKALRDSDPPRCRLHAMTPEERSTAARRAAEKSAFVRRSRVEPKPRAGLIPGVQLEDVLREIAPALEATFEHDGSPDWSARLAAAGVLVAAFPRYLRDTPENVRALLERVLPEEVIERPGMQERLRAGAVYQAMRREWDRLPSWHPIRGLYVKPYPPHLIAPWEDAQEVQKERPADLSPDQAPVTHLSDGRVLVEADKALPLVLSPEAA